MVKGVMDRRAMRSAGLMIALGAALAACGKKERPVLAPPPTPPAAELPAEAPVAGPDAQPGLSPNRRLARAVDLLVSGDEAQARAEIDALLGQQPDRREALVLKQSLDGDPRAMLPADSFAYMVRPGDTFISIARDYLNDSYKFYALARLNGRPVSGLKAGDTILIPGRYRAPRPTREERLRTAPRPRAGNEGDAADTTPTPPPAPAANPAAAQRMRRSGLEAMSAGRIDQAVTRLERAVQLDPGNAAIGADLARARRIQATVRQRR